MQQHEQHLLTAIQALRASWQYQRVRSPQNSPAYVQHIAAQNKITLPPDFQRLYCIANGTPDLYPNWLDDNGCSFLPAELLYGKRQNWLIITDKLIQQAAEVVVFVDFMHRSWEYGFIAAPNGIDYSIGIIPDEKEIKVLTHSLTEFLQWYVTDADELYDYGHPFTELGRQ